MNQKTSRTVEASKLVCATVAVTHSSSQSRPLVAVEGADLSKHTAGHTLLAYLWRKALPVLDSCIGDTNREAGREAFLRELRHILESGESSTDAWKRLTADACAARLADPKAEGQQLSHDAKLVPYALMP